MEKLLALCDLFGVPLGELTGTEASAPAARSGAGRLRALVILCVLSAFAAVWSVCRAFSERLPENVIGYADRATEIYVQGVPLLPVLLCLAALLLCAATGFLFWRTNKHKENTHR